MVKNNIKIANETIKITKQGYYTWNNQEIQLLSGDYSNVEVYSPEKMQSLLSQFQSEKENWFTGSGNCKIQMVNCDSFEAAKGYEDSLVMNFANAQCPGGAFLCGATAQEEALCRNSTLYASISSKKAAEMYKYNCTHPAPIPSEYMLLSPEVCVFRDGKSDFLQQPYHVSVITLPAPNKRGMAMLTSQKTIEKVMKERIRMMFAIAATHKYKTLVLGAWGCGAFGHDAKQVARYFKEVLIDEKYSGLFDVVIFAILGSGKNKNMQCFKEVFEV